MSATKTTGFASNTLSQLLSEYNSDDNDEDADDDIKIANPEMVAKVDQFFNELNNETITTNWTECIDKTTGHPYYWNIETKEVTWEQPLEYVNFLKSNNRHETDTKKEWTKYIGNDNVSYFVNEYTRRVLWEQPKDFHEPICEYNQKYAKEERHEQKFNNHQKTQILNNKTDNNVGQLKQTKQFKKNPYVGKIDDEKIELITSFEAASDSDSSNDGNNVTQYDDSKIKLVAEYNSENEISEDEKHRKKSNALRQNPKIINNKNQSEKLDSTVDANCFQFECKQQEVKKPQRKTFASIITGGRSTQYEKQVMHETSIVNDPPQPPTLFNEQPANTDGPFELNAKVFQRKRRIEFITQPMKRPIKSTTMDDDGEIGIDTTINESTQQHNRTTQSLPMSSIDSQLNLEPNQNEYTDTMPNDNAIHKDESTMLIMTKEIIDNKESDSNANISELRTIIEAKLRFLCDGRPDVIAVQAILIQLETLLEAYDDQALKYSYVKKWLENVALELITLERDAAPTGWKCLWNREKSCYYYKNLASGILQWQYPEIMQEKEIVNNADDHDDDDENNDDDDNDDNGKDDNDEMDICTTPPPLSTLSTNIVMNQQPHQQHTQDLLDEPKKSKNELFCGTGTKNNIQQVWTKNLSVEFLPPGTDSHEKYHNTTTNPTTKHSEKFCNELASFYSDLATIEQLLTSTSSTTTTTITTAISGTPTTSTTVNPSMPSTDNTTNPTTVVKCADAMVTAVKKLNVQNSPTESTDTIKSMSLLGFEPKRKKKKIKKLEPWRSGNLETWIHQWQKAQKEL